MIIIKLFNLPECGPFIYNLELIISVLLLSHGWFEIKCDNECETALLAVSHYQLSYSFIQHKHLPNIFELLPYVKFSVKHWAQSSDPTNMGPAPGPYILILGTDTNQKS